MSETAPAKSEASAPAIPLDATPMAPEGDQGWVDCPYLDTQFIAETNGQRVTAVAIDERFHPPACLFWSYEESPQAMVLVRDVDSEAQARAVVDAAAPIDSTEPATLPGGWEGGRGPSAIDSMKVFAVSHGNHAVVVWTDQEQTFKAEQIAAETISNIGL